MLSTLMSDLAAAELLHKDHHAVWAGRFSGGRPVLDCAGRTVDVWTAAWLWHTRSAVPVGHRVRAHCRARLCVRPGHLSPMATERWATRWQRLDALVSFGTHTGPDACRRGHDLSDPAMFTLDRNGGRRCRVCAAARAAHRTREAAWKRTAASADVR